jgi:hypothetical protein
MHNKSETGDLSTLVRENEAALAKLRFMVEQLQVHTMKSLIDSLPLPPVEATDPAKMKGRWDAPTSQAK